MEYDVEKTKYQWAICRAHVICTLQYFPNHYRLTAQQPLPSCANKPDGCEKQTEKEVAATRLINRSDK